MATDFEIELLSGILRSDAVIKVASAHPSRHLFEDSTAAWVAGKILPVFIRTGERPTRAEVRRLLGRKDEKVSALLREAERAEFRERILCEELGKKAAVSRISEGIEAALTSLDSGDVDVASASLLDCLASPDGGTGESSHDYLKDLEDRFLEENHETVPTGFRTLDGLLGGGVRPGELAVVVAPPKGGKTTFLCNVGAKALRDGMSVVHYTLEAASWLIASKYDALIAGCKISETRRKKKEIRREARKIEKAGGSLVIRQFPMLSLSVSEISNHVLKDGPDLCIVDYGDLLRPERVRQDGVRHELTAIYRGLRRVASEREIVVWTASQSNRSGVDKEIIGMQEVGEDFQKVAVCDLMVSKSQTRDERAVEEFRLFVMASRRGPDFVEIRCREDMSRAAMEEVDEA